MRKIFVVFVLISLFLPSLILGEEISCEKYKNTCPSADLIEKIEKECPKDVIDSIKAVCQQQIEKIEKEKQEKEQKLKEIEKEESSTKYLLSRINRDLSYLNAQVNYLSLSIYQLQKEIEKRENDLKELEKALSYQKKLLRSLLKEVYFVSLTNPVEIFLDGSLSEFSFKIAERGALQKKLQDSVKEIQKAKEKIEKEKENLVRKKEEKEKYKLSLELSRQNLSLRKKQKEYLLAKLKEAKTPLEREIARMEVQLMELRSAMGRIQRYLASWLGYTPTWSEIFSVVQKVSSITGVRPALLLGVLQIESSFKITAGYNAGSREGNIERCHKCRKNDEPFCTAQQLEFEKICHELGLDPNKMPISCAYAMGPSQIIPTTWRSYQKKYPGVKNPWSLYDSVLLSGYILRDNGATSGNERGAVYAYNHSWSYVDKVLVSAQAWQEVLNVCGFDLSCPELRQRLETKFSHIPIE